MALLLALIFVTIYIILPILGIWLIYQFGCLLVDCGQMLLRRMIRMIKDSHDTRTKMPGYYRSSKPILEREGKKCMASKQTNNLRYESEDIKKEKNDTYQYRLSLSQHKKRDNILRAIRDRRLVEIDLIVERKSIQYGESEVAVKMTIQPLTIGQQYFEALVLSKYHDGITKEILKEKEHIARLKYKTSMRIRIDSISRMKIVSHTTVPEVQCNIIGRSLNV